jgi:hypothetical protein
MIKYERFLKVAPHPKHKKHSHAIEGYPKKCKKAEITNHNPFVTIT